MDVLYFPAAWTGQEEWPRLLDTREPVSSLSHSPEKSHALTARRTETLLKLCRLTSGAILNKLFGGFFCRFSYLPLRTVYFFLWESLMPLWELHDALLIFYTVCDMLAVIGEGSFSFRWSSAGQRCCQPLSNWRFFFFVGKRHESRSTTGCGHINFWFCLTQADVIQPESVLHDATWELVFLRRLRLVKRINNNKKNVCQFSQSSQYTITMSRDVRSSFIMWSLECDLHFTFISEK